MCQEELDLIMIMRRKEWLILHQFVKHHSHGVQSVCADFVGAGQRF